MQAQNEVINSLYRTIQLNIINSQFDRLTKSRLSKYTRSEFERPILRSKKYDASLYHRLLNARTLNTNLTRANCYHDTASTNNLLRLAFIDSQPLQKRCPIWLSRFLIMNPVGRANKLAMFDNYSGLLQINHVIDYFKGNKPLIAKYYDTLDKEMQVSSPDTEPILGILSGTRPHIRVNREKVHNSDHDYILKMKSEYKIKIKTKTKKPSFKLDILPTKFGSPLPKARIINLVVNRLISIQKYFARYLSISIDDFHYLNQLENEGFFKTHKELESGYLKFYNDAFAVKDDGSIITLQMTTQILPPDDKLIKSYAMATNE